MFCVLETTERPTTRKLERKPRNVFKSRQYSRLRKMRQGAASRRHDSGKDRERSDGGSCGESRCEVVSLCMLCFSSFAASVLISTNVERC